MKKEILLAHYPKITPQRYQTLLAAFSDLETAWQAKAADYRRTGWKAEIIQDFIGWKNRLDETKILQALAAENIQCLTVADPLYPKLLKDIHDPPFCLFVRGQLTPRHFPIAVVGPRKYSQYGKQVVETIVAKLARLGFNIVSGLALGIDGIAHRTALSVGGSTVAVLGTGINKNNIYPASHRGLSEQIIESGGALLSEYPPGTAGNKYTFPQRNRIVAGMSLGTLVIEGAANSGALITAQCALDNGREVFGVPQNITAPNAAGVNKLIAAGANLVSSADDIVNILPLPINLSVKPETKSTKINATDSPEADKILKILSQEPMHIDAIIKQVNLPGPAASASLAVLEIEGKIKNVGAMMFVRN